MLPQRGRGPRNVKVVEDELRLAKEELQAVKGDLCAKATTLDRVDQEAMEAGNSMEHLTDELSKLRMDLERQEALASRRGEVIAELRDEACTQWASWWLVFQLRASLAFSDLEFNIQLSDKEVKESGSEVEADAGAKVLSGVPDRVPLPDDFWVPLESSSSTLPAGAPPFNPFTSVCQGPTFGAYAFYFNLTISGRRACDFCIAFDVDFSLIYKNSLISSIALFIVSPI